MSRSTIKQELDYGSRSMSRAPSNHSPSSSQGGMMDSLAVDTFIDMNAFNDGMSYQSPSLSPAATTKASFSRPTPTTTTPISMMSTSQPLSGPSHDYDMYKQQTGIVPGALANTLAVNENNAQVAGGYNPFNIDEYFGMSMGNTESSFDFNTSPSLHTDMEMEFDPSADNGFLFGTTVNPSAIGGQEPSSVPSPSVLSSTTSNVGRVWPGMHQQQAAIAKAQSQQRQQQEAQMLHQRQQSQSQSPKHQRSKSGQPSDPLVEQKISQLLQSMRAKPDGQDSQEHSPVLQHPRSKKEEEDMDEDERLLASEEGKKLTSKERRQLRNKVSARAFRSRRKEYITQLESEIANKVTENGDLRTQNRALMEENKRLQDLTRMLLSSPSFSDFLDRLSTNPASVPQTSAPAPQVEQRQEARQLPKDVNPYAAQQQRQQIGMAMIPEQNMDFSMLTLDTDTSGFNFQPQVYAVLETPEIILPPSVDTAALSGKESNFIGQHFDSEDDKVEVSSIIRHELTEEEKLEAPATPVIVDHEFDDEPMFALYNDSPVSAESTEPLDTNLDDLVEVDIFGGIETDKALARYELVDAADEEKQAVLAELRYARLTARLDAMMEQLESLNFMS
ncbi:hypothetical protein MCOR27_000198 [Pyricularia oryzae]|uniref:BZIP domain-containing protein n=2 Tax=Pyricularia TaxID=48558 RepID=A0ABQ8P127_PYRGI|nr:hypothetical protein MCOR01_004682 [Pyricularia oryzae]KAI6305010.1 hypothetical protein MCOR33_000130 [Pyricularia grisea]KAH9431382.1 hypothetical protein MCOR02_008673 [Pyricularia oryzae]KAI6261941.1 hypothetical protein MCOR19_001889 [Pyricularia oryzae]KAI6287954.1 hypothetical protein MCOR26_000365 [Pyricularia oryzae]